MSAQLSDEPRTPRTPVTPSSSIRYTAIEQTPTRRNSSNTRGLASELQSPESSEVESTIPNVRTFVRAEAPQQSVSSSSSASCRGVSATITVRSPICCGGNVLKGALCLCFNHKAKKNKSTQVTSIKLDCIGVESVKGHESKLFFTVAQDIVTSGIYLDDLCKTFLQEEHVQPGQCIVPFELQLPLDIGPGTFSCRDAELAYTLMCTVELGNGKRFPEGRTMRLSRKVKLYPCLDPAKALTPSTAPIDASEEGHVRFGGKDTLKIAGRMHRTSWIAGQAAYVDVAVTNDSSRDVCKIQLDLVRHVSFYKSAAALSAFQSVDQRVPDRINTKTVATNILTVNSDDSEEWQGVKAHARDTTTCRLDVPTKELSVSAGRYFSAVYVIRVLVCTKGGHVEVELPITIVHINSLDVIPSSVKAVSRMISEYALPTTLEGTQRSASLSSRRDLLPNLGASISPRYRPVDSKLATRVSRAKSDFVINPLKRSEYSESRRMMQVRNCDESPTTALSTTKPGIQCDLRRALSLEYQARFSKLDISAEQAGWTHGTDIRKRSRDRKKRDLNENLAHRLVRERNRNPSFFDVI